MDTGKAMARPTISMALTSSMFAALNTTPAANARPALRPLSRPPDSVCVKPSPLLGGTSGPPNVSAISVAVHNTDRAKSM